MHDISIQIGRGFGSARSFLDATDEWVWMRVHELRQSGLPSTVLVTIQSNHVNLKLGTPCSGVEVPQLEKCNSHERAIVEIWERMGLNCPTFTAGSAVFFVQRLRWHLADAMLTRMSKQTILKIGDLEKD